MTKIGETSRIRYDEGCLAAHALNVIGDRWALLVVRELLFTSKRFQVIRAGMPGITAGVLTQRLAQLIEAGVVKHDPELGIYSLTDSGRALHPVLISLCHWGSQHEGHDPRRFISPTALMISMTAKVNRDMAQHYKAVVAFDMGREGFIIRTNADGAMLVEPSPKPVGDFLLRGRANDLAVAVYGPIPIARLAMGEAVLLEGDPLRAQRFLDMFSLKNGL